MADFNIASNRDSVDMGAQDMIRTATELGDKLNAFHRRVEEVVSTWGGSTSTAFTQMQAEWNTASETLNTTLQEAGNQVRKGNSELHDTDLGLSKMFM